MERTFLKELNIWGAILSSREEDILHYTIPFLLKYCDRILIMFDNENMETRKIAMEYQKKYPKIIEVSETGLERSTDEQEAIKRGLFKRFKPWQGKIRHKVFEYLREKNKEKKIDILLFPDSDEIFADYLPEILIDFWNRKDKKALTMRPVSVYGDMRTISKMTMAGHSRIFKFFSELSGVPGQGFCHYHPLVKADRLNTVKVLIHLFMLTEKKIKWRQEHWVDRTPLPEVPLWKLPKDVSEMTYDEIVKIWEKEPDLLVKNYKL